MKGGSVIRSFAAIVRHEGNTGLLRALELSVLATRQGQPLHLHAQGVRGTGKTTTLRSLRSLLPPIRRIQGCAYHCHPDHPHCPEHRRLSAAESHALGSERVAMPFLEISHSATVGTVVGSIDLKRLTDPSDPAAALLPGTLARAHRGIVLVDEINRLVDTAPALTDILLDVMGTKPGRLQIEETGLERVTLPITTAVWATSNPDEDPGPLEEIRRQLADRFDLVVNVQRPRRRAAVEEILACGPQPGAGPADPGEASGEPPGTVLRQRLASRAKAAQPAMPARLRRCLASAYVQFDLESLRAVEAMQLAAVMAAQADGEEQVLGRHLNEVAPWALNHRVDLERLTDVTEFLREACDEAEAAGQQNPAAPAGHAAARQGDVLARAARAARIPFALKTRAQHERVSLARRLQAWLDRLPLPRLPAGFGGGSRGAGEARSPEPHAPPPPKRAERLRNLPPDRCLGPAVHADEASPPRDSS